MNKRILYLLVSLLCAAIQGCATQEQTTATANQAVTGFQQLDKGQNQTFVGCSPCTYPTEKTLWTPEPQASSTPAPLAQSRPPVAPNTNWVGTSKTKTVFKTPNQTVIHFDVNRAALTAQAKNQLNQFCNAAGDLDEIDIAGRTDASGSRELNEKLAKTRATKTKKYIDDCLKAKGKNAHTKMTAKGQCCYAADNATEGGRMQNRRAEVKTGEVQVNTSTTINEPSTGNEGIRP